MQLYIITLSLAILATQAIELPSNFQKCNRQDENFKNCLLKAAQHGILQLNRPYKQLKMASLNPLEIPRIQASVDTQLVNISALLTNCKFWGLTDAKIQTFDIDFVEKTIKLEATWPEIKSQCFLNSNGNILNSRIEGQGPSSVTFRNFKFHFDLKYEEIRRRSKTYVKPISSKFDGKPDLVSMNLEGILQDKELTQRFNKILNDNWSELYDDVKIYYLENAKQTWLQIMNGWFQKLSLEEAFD